MLPDYDLEEARMQLSNIAVELQDIRPISSTAVKLFWKVRHRSTTYTRLVSKHSSPDLKKGKHQNNFTMIQPLRVQTYNFFVRFT